MRPLLVKWLLHFFAALPLPVAHILGTWVGWGLVLIPNDLRRIARINISICFPEMGPHERARLCRQTLIETGKTMAEVAAIWLWDGSRTLELVREVSGEEHLKRALAAGNGVILAAPHLGSWELVGLYCSAHYPITSLYRPPRMHQLGELVRHGRERLGATLVPADASGVRALYKALARKELVGILPDQEPGAGEGVFAPLLGIPAYTMVLLSRLAIKTQAPVLFAYAERLPRGLGFHLHFLPAPNNINSLPVETSVAVMNNMVESCVRKLPKQYQWGYKRFRTRAPGEKKIY